MITCKSCRKTLVTGALYCMDCGAPLIQLPDNENQNPVTQPEPEPEKEFEINPPSAQIPLISVVSLHVMDFGQIISLTGRQEFTLGRSAGSQSILPDIDLAPFEAYEKGTSRLHASIKLDGKTVTITDLGSVNGTLLNGETIPVHEPKMLRNGDMIHLGDLKVQILIPW
jgi:pSer/pThr/pTyr-binding forkhead associated (FHA) protein